MDTERRSEKRAKVKAKRDKIPPETANRVNGPGGSYAATEETPAVGYPSGYRRLLSIFEKSPRF
jgi:hypothetical protein